MYVVLVLVLILLLILVTLGALKLFKKSPMKSLKDRHVVITGGSSGIGKALAVLAVQKGANVSLIARNSEKLEAAQKEVEAFANEGQTISVASVDVSNKVGIDKNIQQLEEKIGPIFMLVNCAGLAICGKLEDMSDNDIKYLINVNLLGTIYTIQSILAKFKERQEGIIVLTGSAVSLLGMFGFSIYSSCKFALRGLAESLYQEVRPYNISVTLAVPPDTDTPGFENENKSKPKETKLMSESAGLYAPEVVAKQLLDDALSNKFFSYVGFESFILVTLCVGMSPFYSLFDLFFQSLILGPLRLVAAFYIKQFEKIVNNCFFEQKNLQPEMDKKD